MIGGGGGNVWSIHAREEDARDGGNAIETICAIVPYGNNDNNIGGARGLYCLEGTIGVEDDGTRSDSFVDDGSTVNYHDGGMVEVVDGVIEGMGCVADTIIILDDGTLTEDDRRTYVIRLMDGIQRRRDGGGNGRGEVRESYGSFPW